METFARGLLAGCALVAVVLAPALAHAGESLAQIDVVLGAASADAGRPRIASARGVVIVVWQSVNAPGGDADVLMARSPDGGRTWEAPRLLNTAGDHAADQSPQLTTDGEGRWLAAWWSAARPDGTARKDSDILIARSSDDGQSWSAPAVLNDNVAADGWDYVPQIATDGRGAWVAVWWSDDTRGKDYDVAVARSDDHGRTWTAPQVLNANAGADGGDDRCPFVATDGRGRWLTVWESTEKLGGTIGPDKEILVARSDDGGRTWTAPAAIDGGAATDANIDAEPRIAADGDGTWIAVWHATRVERGMLTAESRILAARSSDGGITWGPPMVLDAAPDSTGKPSDLQPVIVTDRANHWKVAWWERRAPERGLDGASSAGRIVVVESTDGGRSWSAPQACTQPGADPRAPDIAARGPDGFVLAWEAGPHPNTAAKGARTVHVRSGICDAPRPKPRRTLRK